MQDRVAQGLDQPHDSHMRPAVDEAAQRGAFGPGAAPRALYPDTGSLLLPHNLLHCVFYLTASALALSYNFI